MRGKKGRKSRLLPDSLRMISSCIRTASANATTAVRSASASVAASVSSPDDRREQVLWAGFDKLELSPTASKCVLLLGYVMGFQVFDVDDAFRLTELVSSRDGPVSFLQMLPAPSNCGGAGKYKPSHPILVVVGGDEDESITLQNATHGTTGCGSTESSRGITFEPPTAVRFYSMKSNEYVKAIDFKSAVLMVRCSPRIVAVGLEEQIYCFDTTSLEKKFVVITYPVPQIGEQGASGINTCYGPLAVGPRWLAYAPNHPFLLNMGRVSPKSVASSVGPTYPGSGTLMARYAVESGKHLAAGIFALGDIGYKKLSKYCPELLPDGPSSPGQKAGKLAASASENAGWIAVKDLVSLEVISQFRAHTSPISALCFDPTGTLLVSASVCGNNINIFRIMPSHTCNGSSSVDWTTSCVHLYKMHRGLTSAVIQDICFGHYSQWIAVVSSRGTCHVFILSPFGGDAGLRALNTSKQGASLVFAAASPWWSTSSFTINEKNSCPPPPCTLSTITRIKYSDTGFLNSVTNAAASAAGKIWVPSGAVAAIFHNSNSRSSLNVNSRVTPLEHILVYTPSGFVVQHEIQLSMGLERSVTESLSPPINPQNEEPRVKVEPIQWWDVRRRLGNMEREECTESNFDGQIDPENDVDYDITVLDNASAAENKLVKRNPLKTPEKSHWYLSNAEVQIFSFRSSIWQKSKIHFHVMEPPGEEFHIGGEFEIERAPSHEVEMRHKDLLPVFDHISSSSSGSIHSEGRYACASSENCETRVMTDEDSTCNSKPALYTEKSEEGSSRQIEAILNLDHMNIDNREASSIDQRSGPNVPFRSERARSFKCVSNNTRSSSSTQYIPPLEADFTDPAADLHMPSGTPKTVNSEQFFEVGSSDEPKLHGHPKPTEVTTNDVETGGAVEENTDEEA